MESLATIFEAIMVISFGVSWPASIVKSYRSRTAKGKSLSFMLIVIGGYICGLVSKILLYCNDPARNWIFFLATAFYFINMLLVSADLVLYFRNKRLDKQREKLSN